MTSHIAAAGTVVDLFCGCGGFSLGSELAGFRSLAAVDIDGTLQSGYRRNFPGSRAIQANVADLDGAAWRQLIGNQRPTGVIGGPPCQGFSPIGKRDKADPRNTMIGEFFRHVNTLSPAFFIMENVEGLLQNGNEQILSVALETLNARYTVLEPITVDASNFGAATTRRRVIVVGYDAQYVEALTPDLFAGGVTTGRTVRDAIADLPSPVPEVKGNPDFAWAAYPDHAQLSDYARSLRMAPPMGLGAQNAREMSEGGFVSGVVSTRHSPAIVRRYETIRGGKSDPTTKSYKLTWEGQCPTLRAGTGADKGAFQAVRPLHPTEGRVITVREAARLQGFPDWFQFHPTKWHSFRMIGNSVSPFVSRALLSSIATRTQAALAA